MFSHSADFTLFSTTELGEVVRLKDDFAKRKAKVIYLSVDDMESHNGWVGDIDETQGFTLNYPILSDADKSVATLYDMIYPNANPKVTLWTVFVIDPQRKVDFSPFHTS